MTINNSDFLQQNGLSVAAEFHDFLETKVIPATSLDADKFWTAFATLITATTGDNQLRTCEPASITKHNAGNDTAIPVRACSQPINASWGSLYDALYSDDVIPHTAGLKPGNCINAARRERVVQCAKDFLDKTFPLSEGSHRDAVSYMTYFQNLLVILADGSTTGLRNAKQFVGKNGPADSPDSILLAHNGSHTEITFDCNGASGSNDLACIEDIQLETAGRTLFDFNASCTTEKCSTYSNWLDIVRCQQDKVFSNRDGGLHSISKQSWAITSTSTKNQCDLVRDQQGTAVPNAVIDAIAASLIESTHSCNPAAISFCFDESESGINDAFIAALQQFLMTVSSDMRIDSQESQASNAKAFSISADTRAKAARHSSRTSSESGFALSPITATISTMQSHGYDVTQAATL